MKKITFLAIVLVFTSMIAFAQTNQSIITKDQFNGFIFHTFESNDPMADTSFIVESKNSLVILEPQLFKSKIKEFKTYVNSLQKPIARVIVSFHGAGLEVYKGNELTTTQSMNKFMQSKKAKGMINYFKSIFGEKIDAKLLAYTDIMGDNTKFSIDGVKYIISQTNVKGMPGSNISINGEVLYLHYPPVINAHLSEHLIANKESIRGALVDLAYALKGKYKLYVGSHGCKGSIEGVRFQIKYLQKMNKILNETNSAQTFVTNMKNEFPNCAFEKNLEKIAANLFPSNKSIKLKNSSDKQRNNDISAIQKVINNYKKSINNADILLAKKFWLTTNQASFIHPKGHEKNWKAIEKNFYTIFAKLFSKRKLTSYDETIQLFGDMAIVKFNWVFDAKLKNVDAPAVQSKGRETQVLKKFGNSWKIVHVHYSKMP